MVAFVWYEFSTGISDCTLRCLLHMVYHVACYHSTANITLVRHTPQSAEVNVVNYFITRETQRFVPITIDVYRGGVFLAAFRCENGSIVDRGSAIGDIKFTGRCQDPTVTIIHNITVSIRLDVHMNSEKDQSCSNILIGPESEYFIHSQAEYTMLHRYI